MNFENRTLHTAKIKITTKCNRSCNYCIFAAGGRGDNMSMEVFVSIIEKLSTIEYEQLHINGGEPTMHKQFSEISRVARNAAFNRTLVLGTNAVTISRSRRVMDVVIASYDQVLIGSDDEHHNFDAVSIALPLLRAAGKTVVVNSVIEGSTSQQLDRLSALCARHDAVHVRNHVHHIDVGQPRNLLDGVCVRNRDKHLMIREDGSCYRCFNAMSNVDSEFSIWDSDFAENVFLPRDRHYAFCVYCHEYEDSMRTRQCEPHARSGLE